jgi:hypothetical protein
VLFALEGMGAYRDAGVERQHPLEATLRELVRERLVPEVRVRRLSTDGTAALVHEGKRC